MLMKQPSEKTIISQLRSAEQWLKGQRTYTDHANARVRRLVEACVYLLSQSVQSYAGWVRRNAKLVKGKHNRKANNKALRRLIELTIADIEATTFKRYTAPWQLAEWPVKGSLKTCDSCGNTFHGSKQFCSTECRKLAGPARMRAA